MVLGSVKAPEQGEDMQNEQENRGGTQGFPLKPVLALLTSMVALALGTSLAKQLFPVIGAQGTTTLRLGFSALVLLLATRTWRHRLPRQDWWVVLRYGVTLGVMNLMFYMAIRTIPFGVAVAIEFCGPLAVALFSSRRRIDYLWIACAVAGLLLLLPIRGAAGSLDPAGVLFALAAATCWAGYIIFGKRTQHLHAGRTVALGVATGALVVAPVGLVHAGASLFAPQVLLVGLGAAVLSSAIPMFLEMKALRGLQAGTYGVMTSLEPALTAMIAFVTLGESLTWAQWGAIVLTVVAAMGSALTGQRP
jgi:putative transmembrane protein